MAILFLDKLLSFLVEGETMVEGFLRCTMADKMNILTSILFSLLGLDLSKEEHQFSKNLY